MAVMEEKLSLLGAAEEGVGGACDGGGGVAAGGGSSSRRRESLAWIVRAAVVIVLLSAAFVGVAAAVALRDGSAARFGAYRLGESESLSSESLSSSSSSEAEVGGVVGGSAVVGGKADEVPALAMKESDFARPNVVAAAADRSDADSAVPRLPIYFHIEKTGGTSLVLYLLSLLSDTDEQISLVQRTRSEDNIFDAELRGSNLLCPGSAMFLTTVFVDNAESFTTFPKPLKDSSAAAWRSCRLATSHQGQALQTMVRADMARVGIPEREFATLGMFRDPVQFEQAAWRSELFMYHADRKALGWGTLSESKFGTRISRDSLADFGDASEFARTMRDVHCKNNRDNNYQTKKLIDDMWWRFQERMDQGTDPEEVHAEAVDIALDRVNNLAWVGLTHRFEESACMLAYTLRKAPRDIRSTNYDRGGLISEAFRGNHPHSDSAWEGAMSKDLRKSLYECNAMDTLLVRTAVKRWDADMREMESRLDAAVSSSSHISSAGFENEELDPAVYKKCLEVARERKRSGQAAQPVE